MEIKSLFGKTNFKMATTRNIQMQYFNGTDYDTLYPQANYQNMIGILNANTVTYSNFETSSAISGSNVQDAIDDLFMYVGNGKSQIASAVTDKGVSTSSNATWATIASNIRKIQTGKNVLYKRLGSLEKDPTTVSYTLSGVSSWKDIEFAMLVWMDSAVSARLWMDKTSYYSSKSGWNESDSTGIEYEYSVYKLYLRLSGNQLQIAYGSHFSPTFVLIY